MASASSLAASIDPRTSVDTVPRAELSAIDASTKWPVIIFLLSAAGLAAHRHGLRVDLLVQDALPRVSRELRVAHVRPRAQCAPECGDLRLEHQCVLRRGALADGAAVPGGAAPRRRAHRRRLFLESRRHPRRHRHPGGRLDLDRMAGDAGLRHAPALRGLCPGGRLGDHHLPLSQGGAHLRLPVVHPGGALLVSVALFDRADHADLRPGPRHGAGAGQLVVRPQRPRPVVHAHRPRRHLLLHPQGAGQADPQLLPVGAGLLVAGHFLQLGRACTTSSAGRCRPGSSRRASPPA